MYIEAGTGMINHDLKSCCGCQLLCEGLGPVLAQIVGEGTLLNSQVISHLAAKGVQQKEFGKEVTEKVPSVRNRERANREVQTVN